MTRVLKACFEQKEFEDLLFQAEQRAKSPWEVDFTHDLMARFSQYGMEMYITDRQVSKLRELAE